MTPLTRRNMFERSGGLISAALGLPLVAPSPASEERSRKLRIIVIGGHPDDPESSCGGTMARYADLGHEVVALYLTRGEAGIIGKSHQEAASIRTAEVYKACEILKARPVFAGQVNGSTGVSVSQYEQFGNILAAEQPDIVFAPWPIDTHRDHRAASLLAYDAWLRAGKKFALYYTEVEAGSQTQNFSPSIYVDITAAEPRKRAACLAHASQNPAEFYALHEMMNRFRGMECGCKLAEAFVQHVQNAAHPLLDNL